MSNFTDLVPNPSPPPGLRIGSLLASVPPDPDDNRWEEGVVWIQEPDDGSVQAWAPCTQDVSLLPGTPDIGDDVCPDEGIAIPVTLVGIEAGGTISNLSLDWQARAQRKVAAGSGLALERELWAGAAAVAFGYPSNPVIASQDYNFLSLTSLSDDSKRYGVSVGLGTLQKEAMSLHADPVVIHATPRLISMWDAGGHVYADGPRLRDRFGNMIIAGGGYTGCGPRALLAGGGPGDVDDTPVGFEWAYATAGVSTWLGEAFSYEAMDRRTNRIVAYVQRSALAVFDDAVHVGIRIDLCTGCVPS